LKSHYVSMYVPSMFGSMAAVLLMTFASVKGSI